MKNKFPTFNEGYLYNWFDFLEPVSEPQDRISCLGAEDDNGNYVLIVNFCGGLYTITFPKDDTCAKVLGYTRSGCLNKIASFPFKQIS